jgi:hypothetical protein
MTRGRNALLPVLVVSIWAVVMPGSAFASHLVPATADVMANKLVNNYRQTISPGACTASGRTNGSHAPPFSFASCLPPAFLPGTAAALGPASNSGVVLNAIQDDPSTATDEADIAFTAHLKGVICLTASPGCPGLGAPYDPHPGPGGNDVTVKFRTRLSDHLNCAGASCTGFTSAGTVRDVELGFPVDCTAAAPPASCDAVTSLNALTPGAIVRGAELNAQVFRIRVADSGMDAVLGNADDREFAMQGLVVDGDRTPPTFAGLKSATTCIPGPIGGGQTSSYHLSWDPASDDVTPASEIVYDIYQATSPGGENFSMPTYVTSAGATSFDTPQLPSEGAFYFVVRARDEAGNEDSNKVERQGQNLCE